MAHPREPKETRRWLLRTAFASLLGAAAGVVYAAARVMSPPVRRRRLLRVGRVGEFVPGTWRLLSEEPIYLVASEVGIAAISARCTHLGCTVRRRGDRFVCPCHGSSFALDGTAPTPPASAPLAWLEVMIARGAVYVDPGREVPTGTFVGWGGRHG